ncbi:hypothetical protein BH708_06400 [Brachybacterium sp. P6-10-X1]|uniref:ATP-binding protein n=1 Tax=Brachybacterium sp. P6-10-X1 TaxID=1903186 RepID=UPI000971A6C6|nr:ATP-binding protein [Brachybacterium sp. P6-10-X1]APX32414.1 hypothetical protein BH708_06400 [Brachybacterium sp. P6-10-X1]
MNVRLPSRYESLDPDFRASLRPNRPLIEMVKKASTGMQISGGIRFLPIYGRSGAGKSSASRELATHLPESKVIELSRQAITSESALLQEIREAMGRRNQPKILIAVVDEYEENVAESSSIPSQFIERLSLLDRRGLADTPVLFLWLTTSESFRDELIAATSRNERILLAKDFELIGPEKKDWAEIVEETFEFHNQSQPLADFEVLREDIEAVVDEAPTLGRTIELVGELLAQHASKLQDLSEYQVVMLWPVADAARITRVAGFTKARDGYKLDWNSFYRELNDLDKRTYPLAELNRARLYFDVRLVPIAAADLQQLCQDFDNPGFIPSQTYLNRFKGTHFYSIVTEQWDPSSYAPLRERESKRARDARAWYDGGVTRHPTKIGARIAKSLAILGVPATPEAELRSPHANLRADISISRPDSQQSTCIVELKAYSSQNTLPSSIKDQIRTTLKRHAQFGGFLARQ